MMPLGPYEPDWLQGTMSDFSTLSNFQLYLMVTSAWKYQLWRNVNLQDSDLRVEELYWKIQSTLSFLAKEYWQDSSEYKSSLATQQETGLDSKPLPPVSLHHNPPPNKKKRKKKEEEKKKRNVKTDLQRSVDG